LSERLNSLVEIGQRFDARGWVPATSGNLSAREGDGFWITASGRHKGRLTTDDFVRIDAEGQLVEARAPGARASAETSIHAAVYRRVPLAQAVLHVHGPAGTIASWNAKSPELKLPNLELLKAFDLWDAEPNVAIEVFPNHPSVPDIAAEVDARLAEVRFDLPGFLIAGHGLTAWGPSLERAEWAVEAFEFIFEVMPHLV
jgi:methylthioribulose-1-phosphate dehydratase